MQCIIQFAEHDIQRPNSDLDSELINSRMQIKWAHLQVPAHDALVEILGAPIPLTMDTAAADTEAAEIDTEAAITKYDSICEQAAKKWNNRRNKQV